MINSNQMIAYNYPSLITLLVTCDCAMSFQFHLCRKIPEHPSVCTVCGVSTPPTRRCRRILGVSRIPPCMSIASRSPLGRLRAELCDRQSRHCSAKTGNGGVPDLLLSYCAWRWARGSIAEGHDAAVVYWRHVCDRS